MCPVRKPIHWESDTRSNWISGDTCEGLGFGRKCLVIRPPEYAVHSFVHRERRREATTRRATPKAGSTAWGGEAESGSAPVLARRPAASLPRTPEWAFVQTSRTDLSVVANSFSFSIVCNTREDLTRRESSACSADLESMKILIYLGRRVRFSERMCSAARKIVDSSAWKTVAEGGREWEDS